MPETLPPKTCSIERLVTVKEDIAKVLSGAKTATRRNGRYADPGEMMEVEGKKFEVYSVFQQRLEEMSDDDARREGFPDMESYKSYILSLHRGMPWVPQAKVWVHEYRGIE